VATSRICVAWIWDSAIHSDLMLAISRRSSERDLIAGIDNAPAAGLELITSPMATVSEQAVAVVGPNDRPDWPSAAAAWLVVSFTSDGH